MAEIDLGKGLKIEAKGDVKIEKIIKVERGAVYNDGGSVTMNVYGEEKKETNHSDDPAGFNGAALRGFINAGLLTEDLMPAERLSRGEKAMLAHTIAERLQMEVFWPFFQQRWEMKGMAVAYSQYINTKVSTRFKHQLDDIK